MSAACRNFYERLKRWVEEEGKGSFKRKEVRLAFRIHPSKLKRYMLELERYGVLKQIGGNRQLGYDYQPVDGAGGEDYVALSNRVSGVLSSLLLQLKQEKKQS